MTADEIGCIITCVQECGQDVTSGMVYAIARIINAEVTFEEIVEAMRYFSINVD
jgi:DNA-binding transcriptional regulator GbsR (MarR family)